MYINLRFGKEKTGVEIDGGSVIDVLMPNNLEVLTCGVEEVKRALQEPIGSKRLEDIVKPGEKIVSFLISAKTSRSFAFIVIAPIPFATSKMSVR